MPDYDPAAGGPDSAAYLAYQEATFRWAVICPACHASLDNLYGAAEIGGRMFGLAGTSHGGKAAVLDEAKYPRSGGARRRSWTLTSGRPGRDDLGAAPRAKWAAEADPKP